MVPAKLVIRPVRIVHNRAPLHHQIISSRSRAAEQKLKGNPFARIGVTERPVSWWDVQSVRVHAAIRVERQRNPEHGDHGRLIQRTIADALLYLQVEDPQTGGHMLQRKELQAVEWSIGVTE